MKQVPSNKILMENYKITPEELLEIMNKCVNYYLSEEELYKFIEEYYFKLERGLNNRYQM